MAKHSEESFPRDTGIAALKRLCPVGRRFVTYPQNKEGSVDRSRETIALFLPVDLPSA